MITSDTETETKECVTQIPDEEVGYRRPPRRYRFQKGQSGNPQGRPPKSRTRPNRHRLILNEARRRRKVQIGDRIEYLCAEEIVYAQITYRAAMGDIASIILLIKLLKASERRWDRYGDIEYFYPPSSLREHQYELKLLVELEIQKLKDAKKESGDHHLVKQ